MEKALREIAMEKGLDYKEKEEEPDDDIYFGVTTLEEVNLIRQAQDYINQNRLKEFDAQNEKIEDVEIVEEVSQEIPQEEPVINVETKTPVEEIKEVQEIYKKFVQAKMNALKEELKENDELSKDFRMLKFTEDVINGRTTISESEAEAEAREKLKNEGRKIAKMQAKQLMDAQKQNNQAQLKNFLRHK